MRVFIAYLYILLSYLFTFKPSSAFVVRRGSSQAPLAAVRKKNNEKPPNKNDENTDPSNPEITDQHVQGILESVSDAEALLACRAYLVKRRRWSDDGGWPEWMRRQAAQQQTSDDDSTGFFWEDLSKLEYWDPLGSPLRRQINTTTNNNNNNRNDLSFEASDDGIDDENNYEDDAMHSSDTDASTALVGGDALISLAAWQDAFQDDQSSTISWEDTEPSPEYLRRSKAAIKTFSDSTWKAFWYERRWGSHSTSRRAAEQRLHQRLTSKWQAATQADMLAPLANMTQDEMAQAIV